VLVGAVASSFINIHARHDAWRSETTANASSETRRKARSEMPIPWGGVDDRRSAVGACAPDLRLQLLQCRSRWKELMHVLKGASGRVLRPEHPHRSRQSIFEERESLGQLLPAARRRLLFAQC
jgi:hypothetical protein